MPVSVQALTNRQTCTPMDCRMMNAEPSTMKGSHRRVVAICCAALGAASMFAMPQQAVAAPGDATSVIELRQYKIVHGKRDEMIRLFESAFIDSQEAVGIRIIGLFRDTEDPNRFVWLRSFDNMAARGKALNDFYFGPVWKARRGEANPLLDDNDNVLLLRSAGADPAFDGLTTHRPRDASAPGKPGLVILTIYYLWKSPDEGFADFFRAKMQPALDRVGLSTMATLVQETSPNNFPQLPIRTGEKLLVWVTRTDGLAQYAAAMQRVRESPGWHEVELAMTDYLERQPQVLRLAPTSRSILR